MIAFVPPSGKKFEILGSWPMDYMKKRQSRLDLVIYLMNVERQVTMIGDEYDYHLLQIQFVLTINSTVA